MSVTQYLEFDSTYRNRNDWPLPSQFTVNFSQSGVKSREFALDPISNAASLLSFTTAVVGTGTLGPQSVILVEQPRSAERLEFIIAFLGNDKQSTEDYYVGALLRMFDGSDTYQRRITSYKCLEATEALDGQYALITINEPVNDDAMNNIIQSIELTQNPGASDRPTLFIPGGKGIDNYYKNCIIYNESTRETRTIIEYDAELRIAVLDSPAPGWGANQAFYIRKEAPCTSGVVGASTTNTVTLESSASDVDDFYNNSFIRIGLIPAAIVAPYTSLPAPWNEVRRIVDYDGSTRVATVSPPFSVAPAAPNNTYDIECFTRDNVVPYNYTGSLVSQQQAVCFEIELINLTLPNNILCSGIGGRLAFYPYLYVGFRPISSANSSTTNVIYSNNPNSYQKLFRVAVDNTPTPLISPFIKIDGDGMIQTVKFNPNDSFEITICHANGDLVQSADAENFGPLPPNPELQISMLFGIRRVSNA